MPRTAKSQTTPSISTLSVSVPTELRLKLEGVRIARARRGRRLQRIGALVVEALGALVDAEAKAAG